MSYHLERLVLSDQDGFFNTVWYFFGKSLPTTAINPGFVKKLAEIAANVAAPPSTFFRVFFGVLIVSNAVDPKTVSMYTD